MSTTKLKACDYICRCGQWYTEDTIMKETRGIKWAAQHTAGHETHGQTAIYDEATGKDVAIVYDGDADAHLIAAAPDMLEALEDALALIENGLEMMDKEPLEVAAAAREAIAKAKGEAA